MLLASKQKSARQKVKKHFIYPPVYRRQKFSICFFVLWKFFPLQWRLSWKRQDIVLISIAQSTTTAVAAKCNWDHCDDSIPLRKSFLCHFHVEIIFRFYSNRADVELFFNYFSCWWGSLGVAKVWLKYIRRGSIQTAKRQKKNREKSKHNKLLILWFCQTNTQINSPSRTKHILELSYLNE